MFLKFERKSRYFFFILKSKSFQFFCKATSGILQCVLFPTSALLGASGIVFMLIMLSSLAGSKNGGIPITFILVGVLYLSQQVYSIFFIQDNVANFMHIVGGICGTAFGFAVRKR